MTAFIFAGDMLVMLFMVCLICWVFWVMPKEKLDQAASIPLNDEFDHSDGMETEEDRING